MSLQDSTAATGSSAPRWEVADVFRLYGETYRLEHRLPDSHLRVMHDVEVCRTEELGGHEECCLACGYQGFAFNSCRNRHCPKCQSLAKAKWLEARSRELLPVPYFHSVFTLPHELNPIMSRNKRRLINLLFQAASRTLLEFGRNKLGGQLGFTMVLHTWDQTLGAHYHVHCLIAAGALSPERDRWTRVDPRFLFPVKALSKVFRAKFLDGLRKTHEQDELSLDGLDRPAQFHRILEQLSKKPWIVYCKSPGGPQQVLDYLGRYTQRVAISNHRIIGIDRGKVTFTYRNRRCGNRAEVMTLQAREFIRRFLLHVLPKGCMRIRHYGFVASRCKRDALPACRRLLGQQPEPLPSPEKSTAEWIVQITGRDITRCPKGGSIDFLRKPLQPSSGRNPPVQLDSS